VGQPRLPLRLHKFASSSSEILAAGVWLYTVALSCWRHSTAIHHEIGNPIPPRPPITRRLLPMLLLLLLLHRQGKA